MADEYIRKQDAAGVIEKEMENYVSDIWYKSATHSALNDVNEDIKSLKPADVVQVCRCKDCIHNNDCDIQYSAQAGDNFFCGFGETEKDVREDVYE